MLSYVPHGDNVNNWVYVLYLVPTVVHVFARAQGLVAFTSLKSIPGFRSVLRCEESLPNSFGLQPFWDVHTPTPDYNVLPDLGWVRLVGEGVGLD